MVHKGCIRRLRRLHRLRNKRGSMGHELCAAPDYPLPTAPPSCSCMLPTASCLLPCLPALLPHLLVCVICVICGWPSLLRVIRNKVVEPHRALRVHCSALWQRILASCGKSHDASAAWKRQNRGNSKLGKRSRLFSKTGVGHYSEKLIQSVPGSVGIR
jgi:hypothetical protein